MAGFQCRRGSLYRSITLRLLRERGAHDRMTGCTVRPATRRDSDAWLRLRHALWPEGSESEHRAEIEQFFAGRLWEPLAVLLAEDGAGRVLGLAELSIRPSA